MTHDHDEHGHHHHDHGHESGGMDETQKLRVRIEHWIEHNREHQAALEEWRDKSAKTGREEVSAALGRSAARMAESVTELEDALKSF